MKIKEGFNVKKFDIVFSNPPYNKGIDLQILREVLPMTKELIAVHPSTWLINQKSNAKNFNSFKESVKTSLDTTILFYGNIIFDINLFNPITISYFNNTKKNNEIKVIDRTTNNCEYVAKSINDITVFSDKFETIVKQVKSRIESWINKNSSIENKRISKEAANQFTCKVTGIRGHAMQDDFNSFIMLNSENNKWRNYKGNLSRPWIDSKLLLWKFDNEDQLDNYICYLKSKFARFCLALLKMNQEVAIGASKLVPYLDYSKHWNDKELCKYLKSQLKNGNI